MVKEQKEGLWVEDTGIKIDMEDKEQDKHKINEHCCQHYNVF